MIVSSSYLFYTWWLDVWTTFAYIEFFSNVLVSTVIYQRTVSLMTLHRFAIYLESEWMFIHSRFVSKFSWYAHTLIFGWIELCFTGCYAQHTDFLSIFNYNFRYAKSFTFIQLLVNFARSLDNHSRTSRLIMWAFRLFIFVNSYYLSFFLFSWKTSSERAVEFLCIYTKWHTNVAKCKNNFLNVQNFPSFRLFWALSWDYSDYLDNCDRCVIILRWFKLEWVVL